MSRPSEMSWPERAVRDSSPFRTAPENEPFPSFLTLEVPSRSRSSSHSSIADETAALHDDIDHFESQVNGEWSKGSWLARIWTGIVLLTSVYSTALSGIWFVLAVTSYVYDIGQPGQMSFSNLSTLVAALAKTIELSFELVSVAVIGQELTRRLTVKTCTGINLAQMQLKSFLAQPGSMITNWTAFFYVLPSFLGISCMFIGAIGLLYTTASDALVAPSPTLMPMGIQNIPATVETAFLNTSYMQRNCPSQVTMGQDPRSRSTCSDIELTGSVLRDIMTYMNSFESSIDRLNQSHSAHGHNQSPLLAHHRPEPMAQFNSGPSVRGAWLNDPNNVNASIVTRRNGRTINNVTILLPHAGVVAAASAYSKQALGQRISMSASVTTPAINVLCMSFDEHDPSLSAIVVPEWSAAQNASLHPNKSAILNVTLASVKAGWYNGSEFDALWKFSPSHRPPVFPNLPGPNNTRISWANSTNGTSYILGRAPNKELFMCGMTASLTHKCSTKYSLSSNAAQLSLDCGPDNRLAYSSSEKPATALTGFVPAMNAWSLSLGMGAASDVDGSLTRVLTQLWPTSGLWDPHKPSLAEAIAVLSSSVILNGAVGAPLGDTTVSGLSLNTTSEQIVPVSRPSLSASSPKAFARPIPTTSTTSSHIPNDSLRHQRAAAAAQVKPASVSSTTSTATLPKAPLNTAFRAEVQLLVYSAGSNSNAQLGFFVILMGAWFCNVVFLIYLIGTLVARRRSRGEDLGADAEGAGTWTLRADLSDPQVLFGLAINSRPDERLADPTLAPLPRKAMPQRWRVVGSKYSVYIHPMGPRRSPLHRAVSSALSSAVGSISRKTEGVHKEQIVREKEFF